MENSVKKKKILIFSLDYLPGTISGAEAAIQEITDRIDDIEFHMVTSYYDSRVPRVQQIGNVLVHRVGLFAKPDATLVQRHQFPLHYNKHYYQIVGGIKGYFLHRKYKYDAIWGMMAHGTGVPAVIFKMLAPGVPYALTLQEGDPPEHIEKVVRPLWFLWKQCFTKADVIQSISEFLSAWARRRGATCPIELIRNGANPQSIRPQFDMQEVEDLKNKFGKKEGDIFLTNTARLVHQKGFDTTIRALPSLPSNIKLVIVGGGPNEDMLKKLTSDLQLEDRVIFAGQVDRDKVTQYRMACDIFVGPSRSEGLGNAFLSAMACRLPVIATQVGGISDFLFDEKRNPEKEQTGWAVDPESPEQIAQAVLDILQNPEKVAKVLETAHALVLREYDWDIVTQKMKDEIFSKVLA